MLTRISWIRSSATRDSLCAMLEDDGIPIDSLSRKTVGKDFEELDSGGMGSSPILELVFDVAYRYSDDVNILAIRM